MENHLTSCQFFLAEINDGTYFYGIKIFGLLRNYVLIANQRLEKVEQIHSVIHPALDKNKNRRWGTHCCV